MRNVLFGKVNVMKIFFEIDRLSTWNTFATLGATVGIYYNCSFTESLALLRDVIFDKVNAMKTFFLEIDRFSICSLGYIRKIGRLCLEFTAKFLRM